MVCGDGQRPPGHCLHGVVRLSCCLSDTGLPYERRRNRSPTDTDRHWRHRRNTLWWSGSCPQTTIGFAFYLFLGRGTYSAPRIHDSYFLVDNGDDVILFCHVVVPVLACDGTAVDRDGWSVSDDSGRNIRHEQPTRDCAGRIDGGPDALFRKFSPGGPILFCNFSRVRHNIKIQSPRVIRGDPVTLLKK